MVKVRCGGGTTLWIIQEAPKLVTSGERSGTAAASAREESARPRGRGPPREDGLGNARRISYN